MGKNMIKEDKITRQMLDVIREGFKYKSNSMITEDTSVDNPKKSNGDGFPITRKDPQFSDVRESQEQSIIKTLGEIKLHG